MIIAYRVQPCFSNSRHVATKVKLNDCLLLGHGCTQKQKLKQTVLYEQYVVTVQLLNFVCMSLTLMSPILNTVKGHMSYRSDTNSY